MRPTEEESLFDNDDNIVIENNKITIVKQHDNLTNKQLKTLKEINGVWNVELDLSPKSPMYNDQPDKWISNNQDDIYMIFRDIQDIVCYMDILQKLKFTDLCDYLYESKGQKRKYNVYIEEFKMYSLRNPSVEEWALFHCNDLKYLYNNYRQYSFGTFYDFITFCYEFSHTEKLPDF